MSQEESNATYEVRGEDPNQAPSMIIQDAADDQQDDLENVDIQNQIGRYLKEQVRINKENFPQTDGECERDTIPCDEREIQEARMRIQKLHPYTSTPVEDLFPWLFCCCCLPCIRKHREKKEEEILNQRLTLIDYEDELTATQIRDSEDLLENENIDNLFQKFNIKFDGIGPSHSSGRPSSAKYEAYKDPLKELGFGFQAYFRLLYFMAWTFLAISILSLVQISLCAKTKGMDQVYSADTESKMSLGALGFSENLCIKDYASVTATRWVGCRTGSLTSLTHYGLIPDISDWQGEFSNGTAYNFYGYCGNSTVSDDVVPGLNECTQSNINGTLLDLDWEDQCLGKQKCQITFQDYIILDQSNGALQDSLGPFMFNATSSYYSCLGDSARMYIQFACTKTEDEITEKRRQGNVFVCIGTFGIMCYLLTLMYLDRTNLLDFKEWDLGIVTASDFTLQMTITKEMWQIHKDTVENFRLRQGKSKYTHASPDPDELGDNSLVCSLYYRIEHELLKRLNDEEILKKTGEGNEKVKIAHINFAFDNSLLIHLLMKRGALIKQGRYDKLTDLENKIDELLKDKDPLKQVNDDDVDNIDITRPVKCYIIFETQTGFDRALEYFPKKIRKNDESFLKDILSEEKFKTTMTFLDTRLELKEAPEPTDVIWEHQSSTTRGIMCRKVGVAFFITLTLFGVLILFKVMYLPTTKNLIKYPAGTDCESYDQQFQNPVAVAQNLYYKYALLDQNYTLDEQGVGYYQCFCEKQESLSSLHNIIRGREDASQLLCNDFWGDYLWSSFLAYTVSFGITIVNILVRYLSIFLIEKIQFHEKTNETTAIMLTVLASSFFTTALLLLIQQANTTDTILKWIPLNGQYNDLNEQWYISVGDGLVYSVAINSVYIYISFGIELATKLVFRALDQGLSNVCCCRKTNKTKTVTVQQYVDLYSGPTHLIHFKYSLVGSTIMTAFMYGLALPILFPLAALCILNVYICERLTLAYWYKKPPMYGPSLNNSMIDILYWAPFWYFLFGYWIMGNPQIFGNNIPNVVYYNKYQIYGQTGLPWEAEGPSIIVFIFLCIYLVFATFDTIYRHCCKRCDCGKQFEKFIIDSEDLNSPDTEWRRIKKFVLYCIDVMASDTTIYDHPIDEHLGNYWETIPLTKRKNWYAQEVYNQKQLGVMSMGDGALESLRSIHGKQRTMQSVISHKILHNPFYQEAFQFVPMVNRQVGSVISINSDLVMQALLKAQTNDKNLKDKANGHFSSKRSTVTKEQRMRTTQNLEHRQTVLERQKTNKTKNQVSDAIHDLVRGNTLKEENFDEEENGLNRGKTVKVKEESFVEQEEVVEVQEEPQSPLINDTLRETTYLDETKEVSFERQGTQLTKNTEVFAEEEEQI